MWNPQKVCRGDRRDLIWIGTARRARGGRRVGPTADWTRSATRARCRAVPALPRSARCLTARVQRRPCMPIATAHAPPTAPAHPQCSAREGSRMVSRLPVDVPVTRRSDDRRDRGCRVRSGRGSLISCRALENPGTSPRVAGRIRARRRRAVRLCCAGRRATSACARPAGRVVRRVQ